MQKKSILQSEDKPVKKKNGGLIATIAVVIILCIAIISGNSPKSSETVVIEQNKNTETVSVKEQESEKPVEFSEECPIKVDGVIYDNIIGVPELKCTFENKSNKEIAAIKLRFEPRNVYGEEISSIFSINDLYTDETISANGTASRAWQMLDSEIKSGDVYVYSVYFSDGSEWGDKDASVSNIKKYGYKTKVES